MKIRLECGCEIDSEKGVDFYALKMDCPLVWEILGTGNSKGVFQLESQLGKGWVQKMKPQSIEDLAALVSIIRPGVLRSLLDGKSMAQVYVDRMHGIDDYEEDELSDFLGDTYMAILYQEQAMKIAQGLAGYSETEADSLRKAIGTKDVDLMASLKESFLAGCEHIGKISKEKAEQVFGWIQESQRYSFNKCIPGWTVLRTPYGDGGNNNKRFCVQEMFRVRNSKSYAIRTGKIYLHKKFFQAGYGKAISITEDGESVMNQIVSITRETSAPLWTVTVEDGRSFEATENHKIPIIRKGKRIEVEVRELMASDLMYSVDKINGDSSLIAVKSVKPFLTNGIQERWEVYDVEMDAPNHNFAIDNGLVICNSHAIAYGGYIGYWTAWLKAHFPLEFYAAWLEFGRDKSQGDDELKMLIRDAVTFDIKIVGPKLDGNENFSIKDDKILFGLSTVKHMGAKAVQKLKSLTGVIDFTNFTWTDYLIKILSKINKTASISLISVGALDQTGLSRKRMLYEYAVFLKLTKREIKAVENLSFKTLEEMISHILSLPYKEGGANSKRSVDLNDLLSKIKFPMVSLKDDDKWIMMQENELMGASLSVSYENKNFYGQSNTTCREILFGEVGNIELCCTITNYTPYETKAGKHMCYVELSDDTGTIDGVIFPDQWETLINIVFDGNEVFVKGYIKKDTNQLIVQEMLEMR